MGFFNSEFYLYREANMKLKKCPFCGSDKIDMYRFGVSGSFGVRCISCGAEMPDEFHSEETGWKYRKTKQQAIKAWNKRYYE